MTIEERFDVPFIAGLALREKQIQQVYRPIIAVHKWFARRPGTLFRGLLLAEFGNGPLQDIFFRCNDFSGKQIADPFMGGGTPLIEANRVGCDVQGFDINPMAAWIVREEIGHLDLSAYRETVDHFAEGLVSELAELYHTRCPIYGDDAVPVKYFLWVKTLACDSCGARFDLFPGYLIADNARHPKHVIVCATCGQLNERDDPKNPGSCQHCCEQLRIAGPARRSRCECSHCGKVNTYPRASDGPPQHRMFAIEYHNPVRKKKHQGRFFKMPDAQDLASYEKASNRLHSVNPAFIPPDPIPAGDETTRLHRWGYSRYQDLFNDRQLLGLELSCRGISSVLDARIRHALATNLSDLLRYQNMLCRYDTKALKSLDIFSVHGFPVGLVQCESNILGIVDHNGINVGSGGWTNIADKYERAKQYCDAPFEVRSSGRRKTTVPIRGEWIGEHAPGARSRSVSIRCESSTSLDLAASSLDAVFTDPPYFGNVQYGELMDFCYTWLRRLVGRDTEGFDRESTRSSNELTGNVAQGRGIEHFTEGLAAVFSTMALALKPGAPLCFTFHHNRIEAYHAVGVAVLDSGLGCSESLACPAEMGGSIHIHGTGSSIVDTIFVCRSTAQARASRVFTDGLGLAAIVREDLADLREAGMKPTGGDIRCVIFGHLTRMAIANLRDIWDSKQPTTRKLSQFSSAIACLGDSQGLIDLLAGEEALVEPRRKFLPLFPSDV
jgi:putative DNA methylase